MSSSENRENTTCPVARSVDIIGVQTCALPILIVRDAFDGTSRFSDFQRSLGIARNILSDRLHKLLNSGILTTQSASDGTAYQEYVLTEKGQRLFPVVVALRQWGEQHLFADGERHSVLIDKRTQRPVPVMTPMTEDGLPLNFHEAKVQKIK